ncbi:hypothetical protein [Halococcus hamelinensis]|uniref:Uncharacterized protein n=1 Tax=Halococcus hamelinensis 100A6 TaxID=1132509 RepID=M0M1P2_9EURY|nr:hypothetical protein [Halococcus hamelinensis]EMA38489.1 hypothetical protein C447_10052 [Halococcus hamelinensis 100A6]
MTRWNSWPGESNGDAKPKDQDKTKTPENCPLCDEPIEGSYTDHIRHECEGKQHAAGGETVTDGGRTDRDILAGLDEGDTVQFEATKDDGRLLAQMHHGHVSAILDPRNDVQRVDVEPHRDDDLKLTSNVRNRDRLRLRFEMGAVAVYSLDHDGARGYNLGDTNGTLDTPDMGGGSTVLVADGGTGEDPLLAKVDPGHWPEHARRVRGDLR